MIIIETQDLLGGLVTLGNERVIYSHENFHVMNDFSVCDVRAERTDALEDNKALLWLGTYIDKERATEVIEELCEAIRETTMAGKPDVYFQMPSE